MKTFNHYIKKEKKVLNQCQSITLKSYENKSKVKPKPTERKKKDKKLWNREQKND